MLNANLYSALPNRVSAPSPQPTWAQKKKPQRLRIAEAPGSQVSRL